LRAELDAAQDALEAAQDALGASQDALEASRSDLANITRELGVAEHALLDARNEKHSSVSRDSRPEVPPLNLRDDADADAPALAHSEPGASGAVDVDALSFVLSELETLGLMTPAHNISLSWWYDDFGYNATGNAPRALAEEHPSEMLTNVAVMRPPVQRSSAVSSDRAPNPANTEGHRELDLAAALAEKTSLVDQLAAQLEESSATCKSLVDTVEEQEEKIRQMSVASNAEIRRRDQPTQV
jgi:hypothetical protein